MRNQGFGASVAVLGTDMINSKWLPEQPDINYVVAENATAVNELGLTNAAWAPWP